MGFSPGRINAVHLPANTFPPKNNMNTETIILSKQIGINLLNWHVSSGHDSIYAVGSGAIANKPVPLELVNDALDSLEVFYQQTQTHPGCYLDNDIDELVELINTLELLTMDLDLDC